MPHNNRLPEADSDFLNRLKVVRPLLLKIHKTLLDVERARYEQEHGSIASNGVFLRLVLEDDWFSWLRPISQFIVQVDEVIWSKDALEWSKAESLLNQARQLFFSVDNGTHFPSRYNAVMQENVEIVTLHAELYALLVEGVGHLQQ